MAQTKSVKKITGMSCAACALRIEEGLKKLDGVVDANVNLALERANIVYDAERLSEADLNSLITGLGYGVVQEKANINITGMSCAACATRIEDNLNKLSGVNSATVNLATNKAAIEYDPQKVNLSEVLSVIKNLGYEGELSSEKPQDQEKKLGSSDDLGSFFLTANDHYGFSHVRDSFACIFNE